MNKFHSIGPRTVPWGTPTLISLKEDMHPLNLTQCWRFVKKSWINLTRYVSTLSPISLEMVITVLVYWPTIQTNCMRFATRSWAHVQLQPNIFCNLRVYFGNSWRCKNGLKLLAWGFGLLTLNPLDIIKENGWRLPFFQMSAQWGLFDYPAQWLFANLESLIDWLMWLAMEPSKPPFYLDSKSGYRVKWEFPSLGSIC